MELKVDSAYIPGRFAGSEYRDTGGSGRSETLQQYITRAGFVKHFQTSVGKSHLH